MIWLGIWIGGGGGFLSTYLLSLDDNCPDLPDLPDLAESFELAFGLFIFKADC